jgi:hypothetical protein
LNVICRGTSAAGSGLSAKGRLYGHVVIGRKRGKILCECALWLRSDMIPLFHVTSLSKSLARRFEKEDGLVYSGFRVLRLLVLALNPSWRPDTRDSPSRSMDISGESLNRLAKHANGLPNSGEPLD